MLKLKLKLVETLKKMNSTYQKTSADYDEEFLFFAIKGIFTSKEITESSAVNKLTPLNRDKLAFLKGIYQYHLIMSFGKLNIAIVFS